MFLSLASTSLTTILLYQTPIKLSNNKRENAGTYLSSKLCRTVTMGGPSPSHFSAFLSSLISLHLDIYKVPFFLEEFNQGRKSCFIWILTNVPSGVSKLLSLNVMLPFNHFFLFCFLKPTKRWCSFLFFYFYIYVFSKVYYISIFFLILYGL